MRVIMSKKYVDDCIFCKINKGEIPSTTIYEDDDFKVMLDINPTCRDPSKESYRGSFRACR